MSQRTDLEHVIHARPGTGENAAMFVAQCLSMHPFTRTTYENGPKKGEKVKKETPVWLESGRFQELRRKKSKENVDAFKKLREGR